MAFPESKIVEPASSEGAPALKDSRQRGWLLVLLFTAMLISYVHRSALSVAATFISADLNLSKTEVGVLLSSFFWIYAFMQIPAGWIVDRFGVRRAYSLGFIFWSLASTLTGFGVGMASLLGLRIATGAGQAITFPASSRACANWCP
jgi:ACS family D-galactonate transporter-like MFS transporter